MRRKVVLLTFCIGTMVLGASTAAADAANPAPGWPGLRGPTYDGAVREARLLGGSIPARLVIGWKRPLGSGYSSVAAGDGRLVTMFASGDADVAAAFDATSGAEIWRYRVGDTNVGHDGSHDGPIATPLLSGGRVYGLGPLGQLFALDAVSGRQIWAKDIVKEHGAQKPFDAFACSPILIDNVLVVVIGAGPGKAVAGFHPDDGKLLWSAGDDTIGYHSPIAATIGGKLQAVAAGTRAILGLDAKSGAVLWSFAHEGDDGGDTFIPVPAGDGRFLLLNKSDSSTMIQVSRESVAAYKVAPLWTSNSIKNTSAARPGRLETLEYVSTAQEGLKRTAQVYLPAGYEAGAGRRYPVVYVHNGKEALEKGDMKNTLDHLIGATVEPVIAVFVIPDPNNPRRDLRRVEPYTEMLVKDLVPLIDGRYRTIAEAAGRATAGAAAGANVALLGGLRRSDVFSRVGAQSAMMVGSSEYESVLGQAEERPLVIYLEWGTYHQRSPNETLDMAKANRQLWERLRQHVYRPAGGEVPEGFGWKSWRAHTGDMLAALFPLRREQAAQGGSRALVAALVFRLREFFGLGGRRVFTAACQLSRRRSGRRN